MSPLRGEIFWVDFYPARGVEQAGRRPALVIQNNWGNETGPYTVVAAISSGLVRDYPFVVPLEVEEGGLRRKSYVNCSQVMTVDKSRLGSRIGSLGEARMRQVDKALRHEFGL
jgi:mRNA interferase MazF